MVEALGLQLHSGSVEDPQKVIFLARTTKGIGITCANMIPESNFD